MDRVDTVAQWLAVIDDRYPEADAAGWDHVGLQVGAPTATVERVLVSLDVTLEVVAEAAAVEHTLLVAHHPLLFSPLRSLTPDTPAGAVALAAAAAGVAVTAAHTNLDVDPAGTSRPVADVLGLRDVVPLSTSLRGADRVKLVVFVPTTHTTEVLDALAAAGAGRSGDYERAAFAVTGTGTFTPLPGATPFVGEVGRPEEVVEDRLEVEVPRARAGAVVAALLAAHPYEEVAYDLLSVEAGVERGFGLVGDLPEPLALREVAARLRRDLPAPHLRTAGDLDRQVTRLATVGGAGEGLLGAAVASGAQCYVTGDLKHHVVLDALAQGLTLVDAGHHATEQAAMPAFVAALRAAASASGLASPVVGSTVDTCPWSS